MIRATEDWGRVVQCAHRLVIERALFAEPDDAIQRSTFISEARLLPSSTICLSSVVRRATISGCFT